MFSRSLEGPSLFGPGFWFDNNVLTARTSVILQLLSLLSYRRIVRVYKRTRRIVINDRSFWFFHRRREFRHDEIDHVAYKYSGPVGLDLFVVKLRFIDRRPSVNLFSFVGKAPSDPSVPLRPEELVEFHGDQEVRSREYVELLTQFLRVPLGPQVGRRRRDAI